MSLPSVPTHETFFVIPCRALPPARESVPAQDSRRGRSRHARPSRGVPPGASDPPSVPARGECILLAVGRPDDAGRPVSCPTRPHNHRRWRLLRPGEPGRPPRHLPPQRPEPGADAPRHPAHWRQLRGASVVISRALVRIDTGRDAETPGLKILVSPVTEILAAPSRVIARHAPSRVQHFPQELYCPEDRGKHHHDHGADAHSQNVIQPA